MLAVQEYLKSGKTHADLEAELGIKATFHETKPLVILNYSQIESPKTNPIVRECRALLLRADTHELVARSFSRFFNWGEVADEMGNFDFSDFVVHTKEDGSLVVMYHFDQEWHANTRGSFALDNMQFCEFTWRQAFAESIGLKQIADFGFDDTGLSLICEYCSPYNKVVRRYATPTLYLLAAFRGHHEVHWDEVDEIAKATGLVRPERHHFTSIEQIQDFLRLQAEKDPTFEGVVMCDKHGNRWKIKSATYLGLHRMGSCKESLFNPKNLLPFVLAGEKDELLTYFEEVKDTFEKLEQTVASFYEDLEKIWLDKKDIVNQKEFALAIVGKTPFTGLLFDMRKRGLTDLKKEWRDAADLILKHLP